MKKVLFLAVAAVSMSLASCGENKVAEKQADAVEAQGEATAAKMDAAADTAKAQADQKADAIEAAGDTAKKM